MAGDWIKMRGNLWDDPRVSTLCDALDQPEAAIIGALYWVWNTADQHSEDGFLASMTLKSIDRKVGISGLGEALGSIGWLEEKESGIQVPRFGEHNGSSAKRRATEAKRKASGRKMSAPDADKSRKDCGEGAELEKEKEKEVKTYMSKDSSPSSDDDGGVRQDFFVPYPQIINLYHQILGGRLPKVAKLTPGRKSVIKARWNNELPDLDTWRAYFETVGDSSFLTGQTPPTGGRQKPFVADIDFLTRQSTVVRVMEGKYDD